MLSMLRTPSGNERGPQYMHQVLDSLHHVIHGRHPATLVLGNVAGNSGVAVHAPPKLLPTLLAQILSQYPGCEPIGIDEPAVHRRVVPIWLCGDLLPLKSYPRFADTLNRVTADPLGLLLAALGTPHSAAGARLLLNIRPATNREVRRARRVLRELHVLPWHRWREFQAAHLCARRSAYRWVRWLSSFVGFGLWLIYGKTDPSEQASHCLRLDDIEHKLNEHLFAVSLELTIHPDLHRREGQRLARSVVAALNAFGESDCPRFIARRSRKRQGIRDRFLLTSAELATLWHPPTESMQTPSRPLVLCRELEAPNDLPDVTAPGAVILGKAVYRGHGRLCAILRDDRRRHLALIGKTGMGKTTLIEGLLRSDICAGRGVALIDPHGDLAETVARHIPRNRTNDIILLDAADTRYPVAFNPLDCPHTRLRPLVASGMLSALKKLYGDSWGPRLEHILRNTLFTLLEVPGSSLADVSALLTDARRRQQCVQRVRDPVVRSFWEQEFDRMPDKLQAEAVSPVLNKVGQFLTNPVLRHILTQPKSRVDLRRLMDDQHILIANVSKGRLGEDAATLLGSFLITALQVAVMSRADQPEAERTDFHLYVDEFGSFATDAFAAILSESRKYRLNLTVANQYLAQLSEATLASVFGNVGSLLVFQVGAQDAPILADQLGPPAVAEDLLMLPRYQAYARLLVHGQPTRPFTLHTLPPEIAGAGSQSPDVIRRASHKRYARPVEEVEQEYASSRT